MQSNFQKVVEFQREVIRYPLPEEPVCTDPELVKGQIRHVFEELQEFGDAFDAKDKVECADALGDALYVIYGIAARMGLPMDDIFGAIHKANMRRVPGVSKRGIQYDAVKPLGWVPPNEEIAEILGLR